MCMCIYVCVCVCARALKYLHVLTSMHARTVLVWYVCEKSV